MSLKYIQFYPETGCRDLRRVVERIHHIEEPIRWRMRELGLQGSFEKLVVGLLNIDEFPDLEEEVVAPDDICEVRVHAHESILLGDSYPAFHAEALRTVLRAVRMAQEKLAVPWQSFEEFLVDMSRNPNPVFEAPLPRLERTHRASGRRAEVWIRMTESTSTVFGVVRDRDGTEVKRCALWSSEHHIYPEILRSKLIGARMEVMDYDKHPVGDFTID